MTFCRWKVIHIGSLACNPYWEETVPVRTQMCTTTLVSTPTRTLLVDPGHTDAAQLQAELSTHSGLTPEAIDAVFITHFHRNHWRAISLFTRADWFMSQREIRFWDEQKMLDAEEAAILSRIKPLEDNPIENIEVIPTPGHTLGSASLKAETREGILLITGDAVLTFDHYEDRRTGESDLSQREALRSINQIAGMADVIIPGHDNVFVI